MYRLGSLFHFLVNALTLRLSYLYGFVLNNYFPYKLVPNITFLYDYMEKLIARLVHHFRTIFECKGVLVCWLNGSTMLTVMDLKLIKLMMLMWKLVVTCECISSVGWNVV